MLTNIQMCYVTMAALVIIIILLSVILSKKGSEAYAAGDASGKGGVAGQVKTAASKSPALAKTVEGKAAGEKGEDTAKIERLAQAAKKFEEEAKKKGFKCTCTNQ